ncbi:MAG: aminotransferase class V-fold PLP-dependent enzyme [Parasphingorhabdus sp.]|uniref:cysteine desulfurase family protein n=1 Tax=Parasphingorhabdus sp. TaxID=2709688 RepID=UPI003002553F
MGDFDNEHCGHLVHFKRYAGSSRKQRGGLALKMKRNTLTSLNTTNKKSAPGPIYLDGFATTPMRAEAKSALLEALDLFGNPNSGHHEGRVAQQRIDIARNQIASLIGASAQELVFTSGATEANELACKLLYSQESLIKSGRNRVIMSSIEHEAVQRSVRCSISDAVEILVCPMLPNGTIDLAALKELVDERTLFVSVIYVSNLTGIVQPIRQAAEITHAAGALFHTDAAQAAGKIPIDVADQDIDLMTISAHKFGGPKGIGALFVSSVSGIDFGAARGGTQGLRYGTPAAPLIASFGAAAEISAESMHHEGKRARFQLFRFISSLDALGFSIDQIGDRAKTVPGCGGFFLHHFDSDDWIAKTGGTVCMSNASACTDGLLRASPLLEALHVPIAWQREFFRISIGWWIDDDDIDNAVGHIKCASTDKLLATGDVHQ